MDTNQFTNIFLPRLVFEYVRGTMPLHALVDLDLWRKVFPYKGNKRNPQLNLNLVEFCCQALPDRTLLFTFVLPQPKKPEDAKFAVIRLKPEEHTVRRAVYYTLSKPQSDEDPWDICHLPLPLGANKMELKFKQKASGGDDLCNFIRDVQQIDFNDDSYNKSLLDDFRDLLGNIFRQQE